MVYIITGENEDVLLTFGLGFIGLLLWAVVIIIQKIVKLFKYYIGKRSIFEEEISGRKYKCRTIYADDIRWISGYKLIERYASKSEWIDIPDFSKAFIEKSKRNCEHCKYYRECDNEWGEYVESIKCKHDEYGQVLEFDKFERK